MNIEKLKEALFVGKEAVKAGGALALNSYGKLENSDIEIKSDSSPVSVIDKEVELLIKEQILNHFPDHNFLGEEYGLEETSKREEAQYSWILDPIDGTRNYIRGIDQGRGVLLALVDQDDTVLAGISYRPALEKMFTAYQGGGAYDQDGKKLEMSNREFSDSIITHSRAKYFHSYGYEHQLKALSTCDAYVVSTGSTISAAYDLLSGKTDGLIVMQGQSSKFYDVAPFVLLIKEAGGVVTNREGTRVVQEKCSVLATNSNIHQQVSKMLR